MAKITVSDQQRAFLQALRDELQDKVQYGSVREQDALQYLIDHFEGGGELDVDADVDVDADAVAEAEEELSEEATSADGGSVQADAGGGGTSESVDADDADDVDDTNDDDGSSSGSSPSASESGDDRLNAMMNLLDTHEDKWREASKGDARYEVDMPDGTTEYVQTKDDVRAHLFKNYD